MRMQATLIAASLATPDPAFSATPQPDKGDTASMLLSSALVLLMAVPALDLSYGGLGRAKNMLSVLMQVFVVFLLVCVLWFVYGGAGGFPGIGAEVWIQAQAIGITMAWSAAVALVAYKVADVLVGLRVAEEHECGEFDIHPRGDSAYDH